MIVFTGCRTTKIIVYVPTLPPDVELERPPDPIDNDDEDDELNIIRLLADQVEELKGWIEGAHDAVDRLTEIE